MTTKQFIEKAKQVHGDKYDYSLVDYKNSQIKIKIICLEHGVWEQTPSNFLRYKGCPKCANNIMTTKQFIEKAKQVHGDKYDYSLVDYKNTKTKIKIICPEHGEFEQIPSNHLQGSTCLICSGNYLYTNNEFIKKAKQVHGDKYDYSLIEYTGALNKIKIICPEHGMFDQQATTHLYGIGCIKCANKYSYTTDEFVKKAKEIHGNKYDYSLVDYKNSQTKVKIICPKHSIFTQKPNAHLQGQGCPRCNNSSGELKIINLLTNYEIKFIQQYSFEDCKRIRPLKFDFYLPECNLCIEFDGIQHFKPRKKFGGIEALNYIQHNDKIKNEYCKENNIKLIRIKYNENIENKLQHLLE